MLLYTLDLRSGATSLEREIDQLLMRVNSFLPSEGLRFNRIVE